MADIIDQAQETALAWQEGLHRRPPVAVQPSGATHCTDCGDEIPPGRRAAMPATTLCTLCAAALTTVRGGHR